MSEPNSSVSTSVPDSNTSDASTTPAASAPISSSPVVASAPRRRVRSSRSCATPKPSAAASAASCGAIPQALASTSAGKLTLPDRVREERQPAQHDPAAEQAGRHREQQHLEQRALDVRRLEVEHQACGRHSTAPPLIPSTSAAVFDAIEST